MLEVDASEGVWMCYGRRERHGLRQGRIVGQILVVGDAGGQGVLLGSEREFAAATEEVTGL